MPRIALITEDAYPYRASQVSSWCDELVRGLPDITFDLVAITGTGPTRAALVPPNTATVTTVPIWPAGMAGPVAGVPVTGAAGTDRVGGWGGPDDGASTRAALLLCRGMFGDTDHHHDMFRSGLRELTHLAATQPAEAAPIAGVPLAEVLAEGWATAATRQRRPTRRSAEPRARRFTAAEAHHAAGALASALRPLAAPPKADLSHAVDAGLSGLVALAGKWRFGIPYLVSEHTLYTSERATELAHGVPAATRVTLLRLFAALARVVYAEATLITAVLPAYQRWQLSHGAAADRLISIPIGADPVTYHLLYEDVLAAHQPTARRHPGRVPPPAHLVWPPRSPALPPPRPDRFRAPAA